MARSVNDIDLIAIHYFLEYLKSSNPDKMYSEMSCYDLAIESAFKDSNFVDQDVVLLSELVDFGAALTTVDPLHKF